MDYLPSNPDILVSTINMWLRDGEYDSLEDICSAFDTYPEQIISNLSQYGYVYIESIRQFRSI